MSPCLEREQRDAAAADEQELLAHQDAGNQQPWCLLQPVVPDLGPEVQDDEQDRRCRGPHSARPIPEFGGGGDAGQGR
jgi:hypothetical protein